MGAPGLARRDFLEIVEERCGADVAVAAERRDWRELSFACMNGKTHSVKRRRGSRQPLSSRTAARLSLP